MLSRRGHLVMDAALVARLGRMGLAALAMAVVLVFVQRALFIPVEGAPLLRWGALATLIGLGVAAYAIAGQLVGAFNFRDLAAMARRRRAA